MQKLDWIVITAICLIVLAPSPAIAEPVTRGQTINATGNCNGALPSFEGALRKRPTAIVNEGSSSAFVSCSLSGNSMPGSFNQIFFIGFNNRSAVSVSFNCTFVDGLAEPFGASGGPVYYPEIVTIQANSFGSAAWSSDAFETSSANVSCALPAGVEINVLQVISEEDDGTSPAS